MMRLLVLLGVWLLSHPVHLLASTWLLLATLRNNDRAWQIALGYDRLGNAVTGGNSGDTISARAYHAMQDGRRWACVLCRLLDYLQQDHCKQAAEP